MIGGMSRHRRVPVLLVCAILVWALASTAARTQEPTPTPSVAATESAADFVFAWPVPGTVRVEKSGEKRGPVKMRYRLDLQRASDTEVRVRQRDFEFLEVNGKDATTPEMQQQLAAALALTQAVPDTLVDKAGAYLRIDGIEAMIERVTAYQHEARGLSAAESERIVKSMRSPAMVDALQQACSADWQTWVGAWVGFDVPPQQQREADGVLSMLGASLPAKVTYPRS